MYFFPGQWHTTCIKITNQICQNCVLALQLMFLYLCSLSNLTHGERGNKEYYRNLAMNAFSSCDLCVCFCHIGVALEFWCWDFIGIQQLTVKPLRITAGFVSRPSLFPCLTCIMFTETSANTDKSSAVYLSQCNRELSQMGRGKELEIRKIRN